MNLKRNLLSVALASAAMMAASGAQAQTATSAKAKADAKQLDSVVVKGIRRGIERSIDTKKNSTSIVEAVSAEDIGKLPDVSIAESIARLPGLAAQRVAGRAQVISVRGLSPDFSTTLLNGRELVSTGDNRSVEFDQYPSELLSGVTVYKTPDAGLVGQGLSGTIDMRTVRPLDFQDRVIAVSARGQHNSLGSAANADANGNRFNVSYIDQFADRTVGLSLGYSHSDTPIQENQVGLYEPWQQLGANWRPGVPEGTYYSDGIKALRRTGYIKRDGVMGTLEFRPNDAWTSTLDVFHSQSHQEDTANQFEVNLSGYNGTGGDTYVPLVVTGAQVNGNGTFTGGTAANVYPLVRGMYNDRKDKIDAFGWNNRFNIGTVKLVADVSWSKAKRNELSLENNLQLAPGNLDTLNLQYSSNDFSQINPNLDYSDPSKLLLSNTIYGSGYGKVPRVQDELKSYRLTANFAAPAMLSSWIADFDVGVNYADREKEKHQPEANTLLGPQGVVAIPGDLQYGLVDLGFAGVGLVPAWNVPGVVSRFMTFDPSETAAGYLVAKAWTVNEKITSTFAKANIDTQWGNIPVRGNVGVQVQHVDQSSDGLAYLPPGVVTPYTTGKKYTDVLPSMNLAFSLADEQTLRIALAKQVARPRVDQMRASLDFGVDTNTGKPGGSTGNALLDPWRANAFDISYEKYFGSKAYVAAAYFYKDLTSYVITQTDFNHDFSSEVAGYVPPASCNGSPCPPVLTYGSYTRPVNGNGGKLQGLELTASLPLDMFTPVLQGFGIVASASFTDSNVSVPPDPDQTSSVGSSPITLPGLSKRVYNFTAYYEKSGFEARVNNRRRSDFIGEIGNFNGNRTLRYVVGENITDAQVSYTFGEQSALKGMTLLLQANNLTNESYRTYAGTKDRPLENIEWGRTYLVGVSYKF